MNDPKIIILTMKPASLNDVRDTLNDYADIGYRLVSADFASGMYFMQKEKE